ncbi:MAG TPA: DUF885 domain-containing protein [Bryobacteraceae bacterium]|nr:DUF885 domain-containing protein [Bryobacteraceae bacterium]
MSMWNCMQAALCICLALAGCSSPPPANAPAVTELSSAAFRAVVDDYFKGFFEFNPSAGTAAGLHEYDTKLENYSAESVRNRVGNLRSLLARLDAIRNEKLSAEETMDAQLIDAQIRAELLDTETIQTWRRNPMIYIALPGGSIDGLMKRSFAPAPERLRSIILRLRGVEALLGNLKDNVGEPPKEFTDLALRMAKGSVGFFRDDLALWAKQAAGNDGNLFLDFQAANRRAVAGFEDITSYLEKTLLPQSTGKYAIGSENFTNKLYYEELLDIPLNKVLQIGEANLEKDYKDFLATAKKIDPGKSPAEVMKAMSSDHPGEENLMQSAGNTLEGIRRFLVEKKIITIPSETRPVVMPTPPYARSGTFASMDTPGAYEQKAKEAFYYVTPPEKDWTPQHKEEHLRLYNKPVMDIISIHEVFPGHFVQFLYARQFPTKTRKLVSVGTNAEGWAHYSEQMMLEQGFGGGDPKIRLAQLSEALLRDCRYVAGIKLHTQGMSVEDGAKLFVQKGFQEPANAYEEARRGAYNPTYLYYTLGKLQIYKLREDYKKLKGNAFSLQQFHDEFVKQGSLPVKLIRQLLLPGDTGSTL